MPRALITGITGQDGQHLAEFLHEKGYEVYGLMKGQNNPKTGPLLAEFPFIRIVSGDLTDFAPPRCPFIPFWLHVPGVWDPRFDLAPV